ncbi:caspase domain-containing protein [Chaetomium sp. MPI-SDFR-AT-0129]|nr:caspase domain-containing protein [Chaetomium sp. MPI-SDFR-AT-0129]
MDGSIQQQQRFALLVGVNVYQKARNPDPGQAKRNKSLCDLSGCVNDANLIKGVLEDRFLLNDIRILTSTNISRQPTYANVKDEFNDISAKAKPGDLFFFYFAGHGGLLRRTPQSPPGRAKDPSLLTCDYCLDGSAVRGWELNQWLEALNRNKVQVFVALDSCYSGGSWRHGGQGRTFLNYEDTDTMTVPAEPDTAGPVSRNSELERSWSINPNGFTLLAACRPDQLAKETTDNGKSYGAFTSSLVKALTHYPPGPIRPSCRVLCDKITPFLREEHGQNPEVYGQDRLAFLENYEPFVAAPIVSAIKGNELIIPMGKAHAIYPGSEFRLHGPGHGVVVRVSEIDEWECRASPPSGLLPPDLGRNPEVVPSKWGLGGHVLRVSVDKDLGADFRGALDKSLQNLLVGSVKVVELDEQRTADEDAFRVMLRQAQNTIDIFGPLALIGYTDCLRGLHLQRSDHIQSAARCAAALAHLVRFGQILFDLPKLASQHHGPFNWSLDPVGDPEERLWSFVFENASDMNLYLTVLALVPGFGVQQLFPSGGSQKLVKIEDHEQFKFQINIPHSLRGTNERVSHRDILRVVVTNGEGRSWRSLELPELWQVDAMDWEPQKEQAPRRNREIQPGDVQWWIHDKVIHTDA